MLVLSRNPGQAIVIAPGTPDEIVIEVLGVRGEKTRIGIHAPQRITVHRCEVWAAIRAAGGDRRNPDREGGAA